MTTTTSFNFSGTNITMIATPVKEDFICDQKEKCSNDLSCIGCYPQEDDHQHQGSAMSNLLFGEEEEEKSKVVFEMGGEPIKELKMPYTTMKDVMIAEGYKFVNGKGDKCFCDDCDNYGEVKWTAMEAFVCRDCAKTIMRNVKKFTDQW